MVSDGFTVIGSPHYEGQYEQMGAIYIFRWDAGDNLWKQETSPLTVTSPAQDEWFGHSVGISGDYAIAGAHGNDDVAESAGAAYIRERDYLGEDNWGQRTKLTASDAAAGDRFGVSVAIDGDAAVVGAYDADIGDDTDAGAAYVFRRDPETGAWSEEDKLVADVPSENDHFGTSVAIDGDYIVVGAPYFGSGGAAYVFHHEQGQWQQMVRLLPFDTQPDDDRFGYSVSIGGDVALIGAPRTGNDLKGAAYSFRRTGSS